MYLKCDREDNIINISDDTGVLRYVCRGYNKIYRQGWNVYDSDGNLWLNYNVYDPYYSFFKRIKYPCDVTVANKFSFHLDSIIKRKGMIPFSEVITVGLQENIFTMPLQDSSIHISDSEGSVVASYSIASGIEFYYHTYEIDYTDKIKPEILLALYLVGETSRPVSLFSKG